jgi:hypothetical protein
MTIEPIAGDAGVNVHLDHDECVLFMQLARDAAKAAYHDAAATYFSICLRLGQRIDAALNQTARDPAEGPTLAGRMVALILGDDDATT